MTFTYLSAHSIKRYRLLRRLRNRGRSRRLHRALHAGSWSSHAIEILPVDDNGIAADGARSVAYAALRCSSLVALFIGKMLDIKLH